MDGAARTAGENQDTVTICGSDYTLKAPPMGRMFVEYEAYIVDQRVSPFTLARKAVQDLAADQELDEGHKAAFAEVIWSRASEAATKMGIVSPEEMAEFSRTVRGIAYMLWACLQECHGEDPTVRTVEDVIGLLERTVEEEGEGFLEEIRRRVENVSGEADAKNSSGPTPTENREAEGRIDASS